VDFPARLARLALPRYFLCRLTVQRVTNVYYILATCILTYTSPLFVVFCQQQHYRHSSLDCSIRVSIDALDKQNGLEEEQKLQNSQAYVCPSPANVKDPRSLSLCFLFRRR